MKPDPARVAARKLKQTKTTRELAAEARAANKAWEEHFLATGEWDPKLEKAMDKANRAYLKAQDKAVRGDDEDDEES